MDEKQKIALVEEELSVVKRLTQGATVTVCVRPETEFRRVELPITNEQVAVETVEIGREIAAIPEVRIEGDVTIIPVVEEEAVVVKRLILRSEVRVTKRRTETTVSENIPLRSERAFIERSPSAPKSPLENADD